MFGDAVPKGRLITISGNTVLSAIMLAIFSAMLIMAAGYPPQTQFMPVIVGVAGAGLCFAELWRSLAADRHTAAKPQSEAGAPEWRREARFLCWFAGFLLAIVVFGFLIAAPVMVLGFLVIDQRERPLLAGALAAGCLAVLVLVFEFVLELSLYRGLAVQLLSG